MTRRGLLLASLLLSLAAETVLAQSRSQASSGKPVIPAGPPTRLAAVALLSRGIDYTRPAVAARLARDGEGEVIGWDAIDGDARPFMRDGAATHLVEIAPTLVAPFRLDLDSPASWDAALAAVARTPAQIAVLAEPPQNLPAAADWGARLAARPDVLFVVPANEGETPRTAARNVIVVAALGTPALGGVDLLLGAAAATREAPRGTGLPTTSAEAAILLPGVFSCIDLRAARSPAEVKAALLAKAAKGPAGSPPLLGLCR